MGNPIVGVFYHWLGCLASASFYVPYRGVKRWSWEIYWLTGGIFSWLLAPWFFAWVQTEGLGAVFAQTPAPTLYWPDHLRRAVGVRRARLWAHDALSWAVARHGGWLWACAPCSAR